MIAFTMDIDWASDETVGFCLDLFEKYKIKCTLFVTHKSDFYYKVNQGLFEIGIHPNFNKLLFESNSGITSEAIVDKMLDFYPNAKGVRSHSMTQSTILLDLFAKKGLKYEANLFLPYAENIMASKLWNGMIRIPFIWEDDMHYVYKKEFEFSQLPIYNSGLKIFNFHPIHIFLNTDCASTYEKAKHQYKSIHLHKNYINKKVSGTYDVLLNLFEFIQRNNISTFKLGEIAHMVNE